MSYIAIIPGMPTASCSDQNFCITKQHFLTSNTT